MTPTIFVAHSRGLNKGRLLSWDCLSCGAAAQKKPFCEQCGSAQPVEGEDSALSLMLGLVCENCDAYNDPGVAVCASCGKALATADSSGPNTPAPFPAMSAEPAPLPAPAPADRAPAVPEAPPAWLSAPTGKPLATQFAQPKVDLGVVAQGGKGMTAPVEMPPAPAAPVKITPQLCLSCGTALQPDDKFCRNCGTRVGAPPAIAPLPGVGNPNQGVLNTQQIAAAKLPSPNVMGGQAGSSATQFMPSIGGGARPAPATTMMFGAAVVERVAKLILVRGQSVAGSQWRLQAGETTIGRDDGVVLFPDDPAIAPRHCRIVFKGNDLWLEPEPTTNGVFLRVREPVRAGAGDEIVIGSQRLRVLADPDRPVVVTSDDPSTKVLGSMVRNAPAIALMRVASEPAQNEVFYRAQRLLTLGRNHCDVNFPRDSFVSERHAQLEQTENNVLVLEDLRSRNGTYLRARQATKLTHGDLLLLGDKVLRVELPR